MSMVISYAVGRGDMFSISHNSDNFTIIDCSISADDADWIIEELERQKAGKGISRFISTHPDQDHIMGLRLLDRELPIYKFYCVKNGATKFDETEDFKKCKELRDGDKAYYISKGCTRRWMNLSDSERTTSDINILWPDTSNTDFISEYELCAVGNSPNNISPIITYRVENSATFMWMGDLETDFLEKIEDEVDWPKVNILFAPHHGRDSAKVPASILEKINPDLIVVGEAPSKHLNYYANYNTITQNTARDITFENIDGCTHIFTSNTDYSVDFLTNKSATTYGGYIGSLEFTSTILTGPYRQ